VAEFRVELLGRLGLRASASDQDVEKAHDELVDFLELAPRDMRSWATDRATDVDEAFALLSGPDENLVPPVLPVAATRQYQPDQPDGAPGAAAVSAVSVPPVVSAPPAVSLNQAPLTDFAPPEPAETWQTPAPASTWTRVRPYLLWVLVPLLVVGISFGVFRMGKSSSVPGINGTPTSSATTAAAGAVKPVDPAKAAALMTKIVANPKDLVSLQALGDLYFGAGDYKTAGTWENKILAVDPKNQTALLALGAAQFNQGNTVAAKKTWLFAAGLYPKSAVVHYDLGFLYLSQTPSDKVNMTLEWNKVIAIDPNSEIAKTVAKHLKNSATPAPTAAPTAK